MFPFPKCIPITIFILFYSNPMSVNAANLKESPNNAKQFLVQWKQA